MLGNVMKGYISHPVLDREMVRAWELEFEKNNPNVDLLNPFLDIEKETEKNLHDSETGNYGSVDATRIVEIDVAGIISCDFVVAWITGKRSYGTLMEIVYAHMFGKPVYIICTNGHEDHPWLKFHATHMFTAPKQFERHMRYHHGPRS